MPARLDGVRPALQKGQFRCVASAGFGDPGNAYPHAMAWFRDCLYVSTGRHALAAIFSMPRVKKNWYFEQCPVRTPEKNLYAEFDLRSQVWRYDPAADHWEQVYVSPLMDDPVVGQVPYFAGARNMAVFQSPHDDGPALYITTYAGARGPGALLVRTENGEDFEWMEFKGQTAGLYRNFRPLVPFKGKLYTAPTGKGDNSNVCGVAVVLETSDPVREPWRQVNEDSFGDAHNEAVFEMAVFDGHLYAGTVNPFGAQLWKTDAEGEPPYRWKRVLDRGAWRGPNNEAFVCFIEFDGALYVGAVVLDGGIDLRHGIGPAPAELLRVHPDDSWELVAGEGRMTDRGLVMPLSGLTAGFNNAANGYVWRLCAHDGCIYAGTFSNTTALPFLDKRVLTEEVARFLDEDRVNLIQDLIGGADLWRSRDGVLWRPVTLTGFHSMYNFGIRTMASTPHGLFVGFTNPYGPEVAVRRGSGWHYEKNPRGGCEIWLGSRRVEVANRAEAEAGFDAGWRDHPLIPDPPRPVPPRGDADPPALLVADFYRRSGYRNLGCWRRHMRHADEAGANLMQELLSYASTSPPRSILELGCDLGATASFLAHRFPEASVTSLSLAGEPQGLFPDRVRRLQAEPAPALPSGAPFDWVVSVEHLSRSAAGPAWFDRLRSLVAAKGEFLGAFLAAGDPCRPELPRGVVWGAEELRRRLELAGFEEVVVADATEACWIRFRAAYDLFVAGECLRTGVEEAVLNTAQDRLFGAFEPLDAYLLVRAGPPQGTDNTEPEEGA